MEVWTEGGFNLALFQGWGVGSGTGAAQFYLSKQVHNSSSTLGPDLPTTRIIR